VAAAAAVAAAACVEHRPGVEGTQSLYVELVRPGPDERGAPDDRLGDDARAVSVRVWALDHDNEVDTSFDADVDVYAHFLGSPTPELGGRPLDRITVAAGASAVVDLPLPPVFGPTRLWIEDARRPDATYVVGTSPALWYRDPYVADVSTPEDEAALDALQASPLETKQVAVTSSRYGERGRLVVTGVYAQGYTVSDTECADATGAPPCVTGSYDHILVFTFSRPRDERGRTIHAGHVIDGFAGAVQEFNGLTEISFPQTFIATPGDTLPPPVVARIPEPAVIQPGWLTTIIEMERRESALVAVVDGVLCPLDEDYDDYKQWKLDIGRGCGDPINVITAGVAELDPADYVGQTIPRVVGTLRPVNIDRFHVWIIYPRGDGDLTLPD
jgi:hypothetical protein